MKLVSLSDLKVAIGLLGDDIQSYTFQKALDAAPLRERAYLARMARSLPPLSIPEEGGA